MKICKKLILASFLAHNNPQKVFGLVNLDMILSFVYLIPTDYARKVLIY